MTGPFDRAWTRRPFVSPARWMPEMSVPALWAETLVTFSRSGGVLTRGGGIDSNAHPSNFLVTYCHAEVVRGTNPSSIPGGEALVVAQWWTIFVPLMVDDAPLDPASYPRKGDRVTFTDDLGETVSLDVRSVISPESIRDHLEVDTETFE